MSMDRSLKMGAGLTKHRNVLTRAERIAKLADRNTFDMSTDNPLGLVKVANRKVVVGGKSSKKGPAAEGTDEGATGDVRAEGKSAAS